MRSKEFRPGQAVLFPVSHKAVKGHENEIILGMMLGVISQVNDAIHPGDVDLEIIPLDKEMIGDTTKIVTLPGRLVMQVDGRQNTAFRELMNSTREFTSAAVGANLEHETLNDLLDGILKPTSGLKRKLKEGGNM